MNQDNLIVRLGIKDFMDDWVYDPIVFDFNEFRNHHGVNIRDIIHYVLFSKNLNTEEINTTVYLFESYTHPIENFAVKVNDEYMKLDTSIEEKAPIQLEKSIKGYEVLFSQEACDAGGYESRNENLERRIPHPAYLNANHWKTYYEWKASIDSYRKELEERLMLSTK